MGETSSTVGAYLLEDDEGCFSSPEPVWYTLGTTLRSPLVVAEEEALLLLWCFLLRLESFFFPWSLPPDFPKEGLPSLELPREEWRCFFFFS